MGARREKIVLLFQGERQGYEDVDFEITAALKIFEKLLGAEMRSVLAHLQLTAYAHDYNSGHHLRDHQSHVA